MIQLKRLLRSGYDCDIYEVSESLIYKCYLPCKIGCQVLGHKNPSKKLSRINNSNVEPVLYYDDLGFVTYFNDTVSGTFLEYNFQVPDKKAEEAIDSLEQFFSCNFGHGDIHPENLMYNRRLDTVILIDWTHEPESDLKDFESLKNWKFCMRNRSRKWFPTLNKDIFCWSIEKQVLPFVEESLIFDEEIVSQYASELVNKKSSLYSQEEIDRVIQSRGFTKNTLVDFVVKKVLSYRDLFVECEKFRRKLLN